MKLTDQQRAAVVHAGSPALVVAGAGSGKTRTLTAKIAHLIEGGCTPERILAITFTNKAADEMKARLVRLTGLPLSRFPWVRTYHSACFRILKVHCSLLGFAQPLQVYDTHQQQKILKEIVVGRLNRDKKHVGAVLAEISNAKNFGAPGAYFDRRPRVGGVLLADAFRLYEQALRDRNAVDFDNILLLTRDLLRDHEALCRQYRERFDFLLVDEYQDTNNLQEELSRLLVRDGNLFCVGDDWQAIYSFRGANVDHFLSFAAAYPDAKIFRLEENFRSRDEIVQIANDLIDHNQRRMEKRCFSSRGGGVVEIHDFFDDREEAGWVARKIRSLEQMGISRERMAVLYRTKFCSLPFEQVFRRRGLPYRMLGGRGFFERKEIMDINGYLTAAVFPKDDVSFERIVNTPKRGIGPGTIAKIAAMKTGTMSLQDAVRRALREKLLAPKVYSALGKVMALLDEIRNMAPAEAIRTVIETIGYLDHIQHYARDHAMEVTARMENLEQLLHVAADQSTLLDYLEEAALVKEDRAEEDGTTSAAVNLATVHAAKGLEFQVVFVVGCEEQLFPHWRSMETEAALEEERRLMYVSVTRAERYLYLCSSTYRKGQYNPRSRFVEEIERAMDS